MGLRQQRALRILADQVHVLNERSGKIVVGKQQVANRHLNLISKRVVRGGLQVGFQLRHALGQFTVMNVRFSQLDHDLAFQSRVLRKRERLIKTPGGIGKFSLPPKHPAFSPPRFGGQLSGHGFIRTGFVGINDGGITFHRIVELTATQK